MLTSLKLKLIVAVVPLVVVGVGALTFISVRSTSAAQRQAVSENVAALTRSGALEQDATVRDRRQAAEDLAGVMSGYRANSRDEARAMLARMAPNHPAVASLWIDYRANAFDGRDGELAGRKGENKNGRVAYSSELADGGARAVPFVADENDPFFVVPARTGKTYMVPPYLYDGVLYSTFSAPIRHDGRVVGVAGADATLDNISKTVGAQKVLGTGYAMVITADGTFIAAPRRGLVGRKRLASAVPAADRQVVARITADVARGRSGQAEMHDPFHDRTAIVSWSPMTTGGWAYITVIPRATVYAKVSALRTKLLVVAAIVCLLLVGCLLVVAGRLARPIAAFVRRLRSLAAEDVAELCEGIDALARGDLTRRVEPATQTVPVAGRDELAQAGHALNETIERTTAMVSSYEATRSALSSMIGDVARSADELGGSSSALSTSASQAGRAVAEIATGIEDVAHGTQDQVGLVANTRLRCQAAGDAVQLSTRAAQDSTAAAERASEAMDAGDGAVRAAGTAMSSATSAADDATSAIRDLAQRSQQIGVIVDSISSIADQTNLLALNAAIEAARAGEHGRGFAVVAEQVRALAEESQEATRTIAALVEEVQANTGRAVQAVDGGAQRTAEGSKRVDEAAEAFAAIRETVASMSEQVAAIAASSQQVVQELDQVGSDVGRVAEVAEDSSAVTEQVSAAAQQTTASVQEVASAAQQLAHTGDALRAAIARFKLEVA